MQKVITFNINPETHVRATQGDRIYFKIPRDKLRPPGLKRLLRLEKYNNYKSSLSALAKSKKLLAFRNQSQQRLLIKERL
jgi:hypothetical protein